MKMWSDHEKHYPPCYTLYFGILSLPKWKLWYPQLYNKTKVYFQNSQLMVGGTDYIPISI